MQKTKHLNINNNIHRVQTYLHGIGWVMGTTRIKSASK